MDVTDTITVFHIQSGYGVSVPSARRYLPGSLIMETTWQTHTGWLIVRDALVLGPWHNNDQRSKTHRRTPMDWDAEHMLLRTVKCVNGTVELEVRMSAQRVSKMPSLKTMVASGMKRIDGGTRYARKIASPVCFEPLKRRRSIA